MFLDPVMLRIDDEKQLFVDDLIIESVENVCRTWHKPEKQESINPVIKADQPWEHVLEMTVNGYNVIYDPLFKLYKFWGVDTNWENSVDGRYATGQPIFNLVYAESDDGIKWYKPPVGLEIEGEKTGVIIKNAYNLAAVIDPFETDPEKRYKGLCTIFKNLEYDGDNVAAVTSPDGIHWKAYEEKPCFGRWGAQLEDVACLMYDQLGRLYVLTTRHYELSSVARNLSNPVTGSFTPPYYPLDWRRMNKRRVWQSLSHDLIHWTEPYAILTPEDSADDLDETYYGMPQYKTGGITMGFLTTFHYTKDHLGVKLVYSRNGHDWKHLNNRQYFIERGGQGQWDEFITAMSVPPIEADGELRFYYGGAINHHDWWFRGEAEQLDVPEAWDRNKVCYGLGLAKLRLDGYASLDATAVRAGIIVTRPYISRGTHLEVNAKCNAGGHLQAEVTDIYDNVLPGFGREDCDVFKGDSTKHTFTWKGISSFPQAGTERALYPAPESDRFRRIRFYMKNAELYSFTVK